MRVRGVTLQMFGDPVLWRFQVNEEQERELRALLEMIGRAEPRAHGEDWNEQDRLPNLVRIRTMVVSYMGWMESEDAQRAPARHAPKPKGGH